MIARRCGCAGRWLRVLLVATVILTASAPPLLAGAQGDGFPRTVLDGSGAPVTVPTRPARVGVVGFDPVLARLVAPPDRRSIDLAADAAAMVGAGIGLLVIPEGYAAAYPALIDAAGTAGVPVFRTAPATSLAEWRAALVRLGAATGRDGRARCALRWLDWNLTALRALAGSLPLVRALVLTPEGYTSGRGTLIDDLIAAAGGLNVAAEAGFADYRQVDDATMRALAPDVILLTPAWSASERAAWIAAPAYAGIPAVRDGRVYRLPFRPTLPPDPAVAAWVLAVLLRGTSSPAGVRSG